MQRPNTGVPGSREPWESLEAGTMHEKNRRGLPGRSRKETFAQGRKSALVSVPAGSCQLFEARTQSPFLPLVSLRIPAKPASRKSCSSPSFVQPVMPSTTRAQGASLSMTSLQTRKTPPTVRNPEKP